MATSGTASVQSLLRRVRFQSIDMDRKDYMHSTHECELKVFNLDPGLDQPKRAHLANKYAQNSDWLDKCR